MTFMPPTTQQKYQNFLDQKFLKTEKYKFEKFIEPIKSNAPIAVTPSVIRGNSCS